MDQNKNITKIVYTKSLPNYFLLDMKIIFKIKK